MAINDRRVGSYQQSRYGSKSAAKAKSALTQRQLDKRKARAANAKRKAAAIDPRANRPSATPAYDTRIAIAEVGDTYSSLADKYGVGADALAKGNKPQQPKAGTAINIPSRPPSAYGQTNLDPYGPTDPRIEAQYPGGDRGYPDYPINQGIPDFSYNRNYTLPGGSGAMYPDEYQDPRANRPADRAAYDTGDEALAQLQRDWEETYLDPDNKGRGGGIAGWIEDRGGFENMSDDELAYLTSHGFLVPEGGTDIGDYYDGGYGSGSYSGGYNYPTPSYTGGYQSGQAPQQRQIPSYLGLVSWSGI